MVILFFTVGGGFLLLLWLYAKYVSEKPRVYVKFGSELYCRVQKHITILQEEYSPSWWCPFGTVMTVVRQVFRSCPALPFEREIVNLPDSGIVGIDWLIPKETNDDSPIIIFLPGITGSTHESSYILHCVEEAIEQGWRSLVVNPRGLGGVPLKTKHSYNACYTGDIGYIINMVADRYPNAKKIGCGFSMGGMILGSYLASKTKEDVLLDGGMIISSPFDPHVSSQSLETPVPRFLFNKHLASCLINIVKPYRHLFEEIVDFDKVLGASTIREFDTHFTSRVFGYKNCREYYEDASLCNKIHKVPVPTICLNSIDDVFAPIQSIPLDTISKQENVVSMVTAHGGHTAFMQHWNPNERGLVEKLLNQWGNMIIKDLH